MAFKPKRTTITTLVVEELRRRDDFLTARMLLLALGGKGNHNQISAALHVLRKARVVDCIIEPDGVAWWYVLPPELDQRTWTVEERAIEEKGSRRRRVGRRKEDKL